MNFYYFGLLLGSGINLYALCTSGSFFLKVLVLHGHTSYLWQTIDKEGFVNHKKIILKNDNHLTTTIKEPALVSFGLFGKMMTKLFHIELF